MISIILIVYFMFPLGVGITLVPELGFILSLIGGLAAIGGGMLDIIKVKRSFPSN